MCPRVALTVPDIAAYQALSSQNHPPDAVVYAPQPSETFLDVSRMIMAALSTPSTWLKVLSVPKLMAGRRQQDGVAALSIVRPDVRLLVAEEAHLKFASREHKIWRAIDRGHTAEQIRGFVVNRRPEAFVLGGGGLSISQRKNGYRALVCAQFLGIPIIAGVEPDRRDESNDPIASAVIDGFDGLLLSRETEVLSARQAFVVRDMDPRVFH